MRVEGQRGSRKPTWESEAVAEDAGATFPVTLVLVALVIGALAVVRLLGGRLSVDVDR